MTNMSTDPTTTEETATRKKFSWDNEFFGAVTVGERGQVVIPSEARRELGIEPGDKLLIIRGPGKHGLMLGKLDEIREFMNSFRDGLERVEKDFRRQPASEENESR